MPTTFTTRIRPAYTWPLHIPARRAQLKAVESVELKNPPEIPMLSPVPRDQLKSARLATPRSIELEFADGEIRRLTISRLGMPIDQVRWETARATPAGEAMTVIAVSGDIIPIDTSTLRYLVDPAYRDEITKALDEIQFTQDELRELSKPPTGWTGEPEDVPQ